MRIADVLHVALEGPEGSPVGGVCRRPFAIDVADDVRQGPAAGRQLVERLLAPLAGVQVAGQLSLLFLRQAAVQQPLQACRIGAGDARNHETYSSSCTSWIFSRSRAITRLLAT